MLRAQIIDDERALHELAPAWDELAVSCAKPFSAPAWLLAWWRNVAPNDAELAVVSVRDGQKLVALAPFYMERRGKVARCRLLGRRACHRAEPLLAPAAGEDAVEAVADALTSLVPSPDALHLDGVSPDTRWPEMFRATWPGRARPWLGTEQREPAPNLRLSGSFDEWFAGKSRNFRQQMTRFRRRLEARGGAFRLLETPEDIVRGLEDFAKLHLARWEPRGGSGVLRGSIRSMLGDAAGAFGDPRRFRLWTIELEGRCISAHLFLAAGGEVGYWLGGFDDSFADLSPSVLTIFEAIRHAWECGDSRVDLGVGDQPYKQRFADGEDVLRWVTVLPRGRRYGRARARTASRLAFRSMAGRLPAPVKRSVERTVWQLRRRRG